MNQTFLQTTSSLILLSFTLLSGLRRRLSHHFGRETEGSRRHLDPEQPVVRCVGRDGP